MKFWPCFLGCFFGVAISIMVIGRWAPCSEHSTSTGDVYPATLNSKPSVELADFVLNVMGQKGTHWEWNWQATSPIRWENGISTASGSSRTMRSGTVRINLLGTVSTVLMDNEKELGWDVSLLMEEASPPLKPTTISIAPIECYGEKNTGCDFDPLPSLDRKGITHDVICSISPSSAGGFRYYQLHFPDKNDVFMMAEYGDDRGERPGVLNFEQISEHGPHCQADEEELESMGVHREDISPSKRYTTIARQALRAAVTPDGAKGKFCQIFFTVEDGELTSAYADLKAGYRPLCGKGIEALEAADFSSFSLQEPILLTETIAR